MENSISNTGRMKQLLRSIIKNRCSLSEEDVKLLNECITLIESLERSPPNKEENKKLFSKLIEILIRVFASDEVQNLLDRFI